MDDRSRAQSLRRRADTPATRCRRHAQVNAICCSRATAASCPVQHRRAGCCISMVAAGGSQESARMTTSKRFAVIASASGNGKTTLGQELARRLAVPFVQLDALVHGPDWVETPDAVLRDQLRPILASDGWVIDGTYQRKLGDLVLRKADTIVWLDLPLWVWLPRLVRRTRRRLRGREQLWNGNRESLRGALLGWDSLFVYALRSHIQRRREWPRLLAEYEVVRLCTRREVAAFLADAATTSSSWSRHPAGASCQRDGWSPDWLRSPRGV